MSNLGARVVFNIYDPFGDKGYGTSYAGNVWDTNKLCPALMTMKGGNRQPMVMVKSDEK